MSFPYDPSHLAVFRGIPEVKQGRVGDVPAEWAEEMGFDEAPLNLPKKQLCREEVRQICEGDSLMSGYLCAMAWGGQGWGPSGKRNSKLAWGARARIEPKLRKLRDAPMSRVEAYELFCGEERIPGLGPAYFTKLLYFFRPKDCYIMDQWTTKSVILLTGKNCIRHTDQGPTHYNTGFNYDLFCCVIDDLARELKTEGELIEQRLFSLGSINRQPRGPWRAHTHNSWKQRSKLGRYDEAECREVFKDLPTFNPDL